LFVDFIKRLWDWNYPFIREKVAYNHKTSKRHCKEMVLMYHRYWVGKFHDRKIGEIKREDIKNHLLELKEKGYAVSTLNQCLNLLSAPFT
jgi:hypothetical protein